MRLTQQECQKLYEIGLLIHAMFPDIYGNVYFKFNLHPEKEDVNMNYGVEGSRIFKKAKKTK